MSYQNTDQINGSKAHETIDAGTYSSRKNTITSISVYSEKYNIVGKIDIYNMDSKTLIERKRTIKTIYDGYVFQLYAQYFAMTEIGYDVQHLYLYSMTDNKKYPIALPENNIKMLEKFETVIRDIRDFSMSGFVQHNNEKCARCIYEPACDRGNLC